jgi:hypothetical protein
MTSIPQSSLESGPVGPVNDGMLAGEETCHGITDGLELLLSDRMETGNRRVVGTSQMATSLF